MATQESIYYSHHDYRDHPNSSSKARPGAFPGSAVVPRMPQSAAAKDPYTYQQQCRDTPSTHQLRPQQNDQPVGLDTPGGCSAPRNMTYTDTECKPPTSAPPARNATLKRTSSLREAARSLKQSKVAKRLRRGGRADMNLERDDEASVCPSEGERHFGTFHQHRVSPAPSNTTQDDRRFSSVSTLTDGMEATLNLKDSGRGRHSSTASQASSRFLDGTDSVSSRTSLTTLSNMSGSSHELKGEDCDGMDDDDGDKVRKFASSMAALGPEQPQLFACPYAKHDPQRYSAANLDELNYRGCSQSYLTDLARVKQHLYRVHERPQHHCPTCFEVFKNQAQCIKHYEEQSCFSRPCPFEEKMTADQLTAVKKKNRGTDPYLGWYEIYKTLFPTIQPPMSPYAAFTATADTLETFMNFVMQQLPMRLQQQVGYNSIVVDAVQGALPEALRDIRRDFGVSPIQRPESRAQSISGKSVSEASVAPTRDAEASPIHLGFAQVGPLEQAQQDSMHAERTPTMGIPPSNIYIYESSQSNQMFSRSAQIDMQYQEQQPQQSMAAQYPQQQLHYHLQSHNLISGSHAGPVTAIFHPAERESQPDYFIGHHQGQDLLPALRMESEGNWIPEMITISGSVMGDHSVNGMMGGFYHDAYDQ